MSLRTGQRLGPYEIVAPLGAGGMGEVYRARDPRLQREIAIKVLPAEVASHVERLKRFEKEARAASALNHPNLVTIYDIGSADGVAFIAMELVDGRTLREALAEGALPVRSLLSVAAQAADGLAKAHGAGIVHRDLKPENLMVTKDGFVKILDFGLAKLTEPEGSSEVTSSPTVSGATEPGVVMGTAGYMSPEQALGKPVDFRSDQFSLGSILYEMATGKRAFQRGSTPETLSAIIRDEPEAIAALAPLAPAPLRWVVERCLAKAPDDRYASTRDLARDLATLKDRLSEASGGTGVTRPAGPARRGLATGAPWAIAAALAAALGWALTAGRGRPPAAPPRDPVLGVASGGRGFRIRRDRRTDFAVARRAQPRHRGRRVGPPAHLPSRPRLARGPGPRGDRGRRLAFLVSRLPIAGVLRGRKAPADGSGRRASPDDLRCALSRDAGELGLSRHDPLRPDRAAGTRDLRRRRRGRRAAAGSSTRTGRRTSASGRTSFPTAAGSSFCRATSRPRGIDAGT